MTFKKYLILMRLNKPIGIGLLLWPTLWALWIACGGLPPFKILVIFVLGTIIMRSAGCVINDIADRRFDGLVKRTQNRPIAVGCVSVKSALILFLVLSLVALCLVLLLNPLTILLAIGAIAITILYPFCKRFTHLPQIVLGASFAFSVPMAFAATQNTVPAVAWWIYTIAVLWPIAYDTMYAMVDRDDDIKIGVKSTAILFGSADRLIIGILQIIIIVMLISLGVYLNLNVWYFAGLGIATGLAIYQQALIYTRKPEKCFKAFLNNNYFGLMIFLGILLSHR